MFAFQLLISFIVGGLFIALQTLIAERFYGFWRGVVLTVPTTMALGLFFIGLTKTPVDTVEVARIVPAALSPDYLFVMIFAIFARFCFLISMLVAFLGWALSAAFLLRFPPETLISSIFIYGLPFILICYFIVRKLPQVTHLKPFPLNAKHILGRSLLGGSVIMLVVILAKTLGNIWGGLFSAFPAAFTSTFVIYYYLQGKQVIPAVAKSLFFPGSIGFMIYAVIATFAFPVLGIWLGTLVSYIGVFVYFWFAFRVTQRYSS